MSRIKIFIFSFFLFSCLFLASCITLPVHADNGCSGLGSFCSLSSLPANAKPGSDCAEAGARYAYGTTTSCGIGQPSPCIPRCGRGDGFCCDPKPGYTPAGAATGCNSIKNGGCASVNTAIGPISTDPGGLVGNILAILLSLSGGIAILLIIAAGYQLVVSQGNPEKVKEGRERIISAISGLLLIIFSVLILRIIGLDLLHLPGFGK